MHKRLSRFLICTLIMCLVVPLPLAGSAATQKTATVHVQARLNSPECKDTKTKVAMHKPSREAATFGGDKTNGASASLWGFHL